MKRLKKKSSLRKRKSLMMLRKRRRWRDFQRTVSSVLERRERSKKI